MLKVFNSNVISFKTKQHVREYLRVLRDPGPSRRVSLCPVSFSLAWSEPGRPQPGQVAWRLES